MVGGEDMKVINTQNVEHYNDMYIKAAMANNQVDEDRENNKLIGRLTMVAICSGLIFLVIGMWW